MFMNLLKVGEELERGTKEFEQRKKEQEESYREHRLEFDRMKREFQEMEDNTNIGSFDSFLYGFDSGSNFHLRLNCRRFFFLLIS